MEAFQLIEGPQKFSKLLQTNKLYSVVGLGKACEVPVQSLWPAAVPKVKKGWKDKCIPVVTAPILSALYNFPMTSLTPKQISA